MLRRGLRAGPLAYAPFRWLVTARTVSFLGNAIAPVALAFAVLDLTGSSTDLGLVLAARSVTNVALLLFGGVVADRVPRHLLLVGSSLAAAATQGAVAALVLTGSATVPLLLVLSAVNGAVAALSFPASAALTPQTVPVSSLQSANALLRLGVNSSAIVGAAAGGLLVAAAGPGWGIAVDACTFALAALMFGRIRLAPAGAAGRPADATEPAAVHAPGVAAGPAAAPDAEPVRAHMLADLRSGWGEFVSRRWVWVVVAQFAVVNAALVGASAVLGPVVADRSFGRGGWGVVLAAETAGLVAGGLVALRWRPGRPLRAGVACTLATAVPVLVLAAAPRVALLVVAFFGAGLCIEQFGVAWDVSLQQHVPADRLARVYSYDAVGSFVAIPLGEALVGPLAGVLGLRATLLGCASLIVLATLGALASSSVRDLRRLEAPARV